MHSQGGLLDGEYRQLSKTTLESRKLLLEKLDWFLRQREDIHGGTPEVNAFLAYIHAVADTQLTILDKLTDPGPDYRVGLQGYFDAMLDRFLQPEIAR